MRYPLRLPLIRSVRHLLLAAALALPALPHAPLLAQTPAAAADTALHEVRVRDGSVFVGRVVESTPDRVILETEAGVRMEIPRERIVSVRRAQGPARTESAWSDDPNTTRLFFGPTGRTLPKGSGYFGVFELFFPFVAYGVTDWLTVAGGTPIFPGLMGEIFYFAPKVRVFSMASTDVSAGVLAFATTDTEAEPVGIVYGAGTYGGSDRAATAGIGWVYQSTDVENRPMLMVGGESRAGRNLKLVSENYWVPGESFGLFSGGVRFFGERLSGDVGVAAGGDGNDFECCFPLVNFVYNFGPRR